MKKNNGFTLIELLAVLVILAIIALITTPIVLSAISTAQANANKESARSFVQAAEFYCATQLLAGSAAPATVTSTASVVAPAGVTAVFKGKTPYTASLALNTSSCVVTSGTVVVVNGGITYTVGTDI